MIKTKSIIMEEQGSIIQEFTNTSVFPGDMYQAMTRLDKHRQKTFMKRRPNKSRGGFMREKFDIFFLLGYELSRKDVFYEIWYDSFTDTYAIIDKYGAQIGKDHKLMPSTLDEFIDIIGEKEPSMSKDEIDFAEAALKKIARQKHRRGRLEATEINVAHILEETVASRNALALMINNELREYQSTKMDRIHAKKWWKVWGKDVEFPQKYLSKGLTGKIQKLLGREKESTFIVGYELMKKINVEIWYVKDVKTNQGTYYVFNLTSGELVSEKLRNLRLAYAEMAKKIALPLLPEEEDDD